MSIISMTICDNLYGKPLLGYQNGICMDRVYSNYIEIALSDGGISVSNECLRNYISNILI